MNEMNETPRNVTKSGKPADDLAVAAVRRSEALGRRYGVRGTPAWLLAKRLISGLLPASEFERLAEYAKELAQ